LFLKCSTPGAAAGSRVCGTIIKFESGVFGFPADPALFLRSEEARSSTRRDAGIIKFESDVFLISPSR